jgi:hypothetical protein
MARRLVRTQGSSTSSRRCHDQGPDHVLSLEPQDVLNGRPVRIERPHPLALEVVLHEDDVVVAPRQLQTDVLGALVDHGE